MNTVTQRFRFDDDIHQLLQQLHAERCDEVGEKWRILCPYPDHHDTDPSCYLNRRRGTFKCYGCGKYGSLKRFAHDLGLTYQGEEVADPARDEADPYYFLQQDLHALDDVDESMAVDNHRADHDGSTIAVPSLLRPFPDGVRWRRLRASLLQAVGAQLWFDDWHGGCEIDRVWFPVMMSSRLAGWFGRVKSRREHRHHPNCEQIPKYRNNQHQQTRRLLFPYDYVQQHFGRQAVVLVEGQVDALTLIQDDIPALAIFGTNNWDDFKRTELLGRGGDDGFSQVIVAMDGDEAGHKLQTRLVPELKSDFAVHSFAVPDGEDPASMSASYRTALRRLLHH